MEILQTIIYSIFKFLNHDFNVLGYEISLFQVFIVGSILTAVGTFWANLKN